ncbi:MAG: hypothetical protein MUO29_02475 [Desulfobacterales bacterium]|nr:hypothetical protein [Desulfobacterales bacterium]
MTDFFKWLILGWSIVVVGIAALGTILIVKYGEIKKIETDDITLCFIIVFLLAHSYRCLLDFGSNPRFLARHTPA